MSGPSKGVKSVSKKNGFTLTEVLIVIVILGILASLVIPRFLPQGERARVAEAISMLSAIRQGEASYQLENGNYLALAAGGNWEAIGLEDPNGAANSFFGYAVNVPPSAGCADFTAVATRNAVNDPGGNAGNTIGIDSDGSYCGTHPNVPLSPTTPGCAC